MPAGDYVAVIADALPFGRAQKLPHLRTLGWGDGSGPPHLFLLPHHLSEDSGCADLQLYPGMIV